MKIVSCCLERAAFRPQDEPKAPGPDVIFLGRSNVGKSSLINRLLGVRGLARTSSQPGKTQSVNFYRVNDCCYFVDLPGYGYARVPEAVRRSWQPLIEGFLERRRERIVLAVLTVDARRKPTGLDRTMRDWLEAREIPYVVAATKSDKLSGNERGRSIRELERDFPAPASGVGPLMVSVESGLGIRELWRRFDDALESAKARDRVR